MESFVPQGYLLSKATSSPPSCPPEWAGKEHSGGQCALTSVDDDVLGQVPHIHEGLATHAALVWADVVMVTNVIGQLA